MKRIIVKFLFLVHISFLAISLLNCYSTKIKVKGSDARKWTYFRIHADADDDPIFVKLQDDLNIDPKMETYTIVVNIKKDNPQPFIIFGDIDESSPKKFLWSKLSKDVQNGLINWTGSNKERMD